MNYKKYDIWIKRIFYTLGVLFFLFIIYASINDLIWLATH